MMAYIGHYIKSQINFLLLSKDIQKNPDLIADLFTLIYVVEALIQLKGMDIAVKISISIVLTYLIARQIIHTIRFNKWINKIIG